MNRNRIRLIVERAAKLSAGIALVGCAISTAQTFTTTVPGDVMDQFRSARTLWSTGVWGYANKLFGILAVIEFAWSAAVMVLEKADMQSWTAALVRKIMWIGAFYALLVNGNSWIPAIIDSFHIIGTNAAALGSPLSPGDVFAQGLGISGALLDAASTSAFLTNPASSLSLALAAILIVLSYTIIAINFIVTVVESYIIVSVGYIFLGFGGSRWTAPYVERYLGLSVSIGVKIILLYCLISAGLGLGVGWLSEAEGVGTSSHPAMTAFDVMGAALIFMMLCWQIPKLFAAILGGSPALTGGDLIATAGGLGMAGAAVATSAYGMGAQAVGGMRALLGVGAAASATGSSLAPVMTAAGSAGVNPPPPASNGTTGRSVQPEPPGSGSSTGYSRQGELFPQMRRIGRAFSGDAAPPASPPRMPLDMND